MSAKIVITGANSAVGRAILRVAVQQQEPAVLIAAVRSERAIAEVQPIPPNQVARIDYEDSSSLKAAFSGASAVIHLAGTLFERPGSTYDSANVQTARAVADAAAQSGVQKVVLVSAIGADPGSRNAYWRTKGEAEAAVRAGRCPHTILRVPLLLGAGTEGTAALQRHVMQKSVTLPGGGRNQQQPLLVDDLARAALAASTPSVACNRTLNLVGPISLPERDVLRRSAQLRARDVRIRALPIGLLRLAIRVRRQFVGGGFSPDILDVITADTNIDPQPAATELGIHLTGLDDMLNHSLGPVHSA
ncbi:MAG TPA: NAD(P)H-binding protein [Vicinamibacterales bacterium]|jgi:NADH dehydrogenase